MLLISKLFYIWEVKSHIENSTIFSLNFKAN